MKNGSNANNLRAIADDLAEHRPNVANAIREAAQDIDDLRAACASLGPPPAMRLAMYRAAILGNISTNPAGKFSQSLLETIEASAHAMLAAEKPEGWFR